MEHFLFPAHVTIVLLSLQIHMVQIYTNMNAFMLHAYCEEKNKWTKKIGSFFVLITCILIVKAN